jgi:hypothetical protein
MAEPEYRPDKPSLIGSRLKIQRAEQHLDELEPEMRTYIEGDPYGIAKPNVEGEWIVVRFAEVRRYPDPRWGVRVGEFLHDLRSALDNLVWQLVLVNGEKPGDHNQFPIYTDASKPPGKARLKRLKGMRGATRMDDMLLGVHADYAATIKGLQPYLGLQVHREHKVALGALADLNNIDKHRFVHPAIGFREAGSESYWAHVGGPAPTDVEIEYTTGPIYPGAELFRWRVVGAKDSEVAMQGSVPHDIAFGHPHTTLSHMDWLQERIGQIVERFAPAFPPGPESP